MILYPIRYQHELVAWAASGMVLVTAKEEGATRHKQSVQEHILRITVQAIQPPAVLLALGFAVLWVSSGFRKP
jgi:hypothetical protein